jgi:HSP20 family molecular chaperone IbpA
MWSVEQVQTRDKESDNPWFGHLFVSLGPGREAVFSRRSRAWHPPTDVYETDTHIMVKVEVAGLTEDDFAVRLQGRSLEIAGRRHDPASKLACQQMEISYGAFHSDVCLPCDVDESAVRAKYENGFLFIMLPKARKQTQIEVVVIERDV